MVQNPNKFYIIDGMALLFRSYFAMSRANLTLPTGEPIGAVYGFIKLLIKILKEQNPTHFAVAWEAGKPNFRHELYPAYKANRSPAPVEIKQQIPIMQAFLTDCGIPSFAQVGFEGDDIIGTLAIQMAEHGEVYIVSSDKDFLQFISDKIFLFSLKKGDDFETWGRQSVIDYFGVPPELVTDVMALQGDAVDNVKGVAGIGEKTAAKLISENGSLDDLYQNLDNVRNKRVHDLLADNKEAAFLAKQLVQIRTDVPLGVTETGLQYNFQKLKENSPAREILTKWGMTSLVKFLGEEKKEKPIPAWLNSTPEKVIHNLSTIDIGQTEQNSSENTNKICEPVFNSEHYHLVRTKKELLKICEQIKSPTLKCFSFDTETTGLNYLEDIPIGMSLAFTAKEAYYIPIHTQYFSQNIFSDYGEFEFTKEFALHELGQAFQARTAIGVAHNLKYDLHMLTNLDFTIGKAPLACSMVCAWVLNSSRESFSLDNLSMSLLHQAKIPTSALIGKETKRQSMLEVPLEELSKYASEDADATLQIWQKLSLELEQNPILQKLFWDMEMPFLLLLLEMERRGVYADPAYLQNMATELNIKLKEIDQKIFDQAGETFNIQSPKQLGTILFDKLQVHTVGNFKGKLPKTTLGYKTDESILKEFIEHPFVELILERRELAKLLSTYIEAIPKLINAKTGRVHTDFFQIGTETGRLSSRNPNLQNIPVRSDYGKLVRKAFCAQSDCNILTIADYSQIELRILAELSECENLRAAFLNNADIHKETAAKILNKIPAEVTSEERSNAKAINFGIIYGMGAQRLARDQKITYQAAKSFIEKYFLNYPKIEEYIDRKQLEAHKEGFVTTYFGRIRRIANINSTNKAIQKNSENIAINSPLQGTAADIMKLGMLKIQQKIQALSLQTKIILQVHDEIMLEGPKEEAAQIKVIVQEALENVVKLSIPLKVDIGQGANWIDAKK